MRKTYMTLAIQVAALVLLAGTAGAGAAGSGQAPPGLAGRWDATVVVNNVEVPFTFEVAGEGKSLSGSFFNGDRRITSTSSEVADGAVTFGFGQFGSTLRARLADGRLTGEYQRARGTPYPFQAGRAAAPATAAGDVPSIGGTWLVGAKSRKGETAWRFIAQQNGAQVSATILRVDGDTGTLTGSYRDGRFVLSHFSGARPLLLEVTLAPDGTLLLKQNKQTELVAAREGADTAKAFGTPTDPGAHTTVKDAGEVFQFSFPDLDGRIVSNTDDQFRGKVLLVNISGSWCPNCHDEEPFLVSLYEKYRARGLEVVTLSFEEAEQQPGYARLRAFIKTYGIQSTVLLAGEPDTASAKLPQAVNLNAFPTTFFIGRDGRVRGTHAGFPSPGSGEYYTKAERDVTAKIEKLLAERVPTSW
jgi:thiol-disulfide isomerase/thioredoxin